MLASNKDLSFYIYIYFQFQEEQMTLFCSHGLVSGTASIKMLHAYGLWFTWMSIADVIIIDFESPHHCNSAIEGAYARVCAIACGHHFAIAACNKDRECSVVVVVVVELSVAAEVGDGEVIRQRGWLL